MSSWPLAISFDFEGHRQQRAPSPHGLSGVLRAEGIELSDEQYYHDLIGFDDAGRSSISIKSGKSRWSRKLLWLMTRKAEMTMELIPAAILGVPG